MMSPVALLERFNATWVPDKLFGKAGSSHAGWTGEVLSFWMVEVSTGNGERHVVVQPIAVKQGGTRSPAVERQGDGLFRAPTSSPKLSNSQRQELFAAVIEPTL